MPFRSQRPRPLALLGGLLALALAVLLPVEAAAQWIVRGSAVAVEDSRAGVLLWKLATALLGILWIAADALRPADAREADALRPADAPRNDRATAPPLQGRRAPAAAPPWMGGAALLLVAAGLALRCLDLSAGLWFDEIDTLLRYADGRLAHAFGTFETQNNHLAYSVLANLSFQALGASAAALRLPAVLLGALSLWALWRFALRVAPPAEALLATALLALSSHHVWFSQDARGYTGMLCATLAASSAFLALLEARETAGPRAPFVYGAWAAFGVWMHPTAVFVVVAHFAIWAVLALRRPQARANRLPPLWGFLWAGLLSACGYALVLPQMARALGGPSMEGFATEWKNPLWLLRETAVGLAAGLPGGWFALAAGAVVLALGVRSFAREGFALLALLLLPAAVTAAVVLLQGHNLWPRFFFFSAGFGVLLAVRGLAAGLGLLARGPFARHARVLFAAAGLALCAASAAILPRAYGPKQDFQAAAAFVDARAPAGAVATLEMGNLPFLDYLREPWERLGDLAALEQFEAAHPETWIVVATPDYLAAVQPRTWEYLQRNYREERVFSGTLRGGEILVKVRGPAGRDH